MDGVARSELKNGGERGGFIGKNGEGEKLISPQIRIQSERDGIKIRTGRLELGDGLIWSCEGAGGENGVGLICDLEGEIGFNLGI